MRILCEKSRKEGNYFTWEREMALAKMKMSTSCGHLDSYLITTDLIPQNQEFSNLILKLCCDVGTFRGGQHTKGI